MSNTLTTVDPTLIAQEGLAAFKAALAPLRSLSFMPSPDPVSKYATINVPLITAMSAGDFAGDYESGDSTVSGKQVTLNQHKFRSFHITDVEHAKNPFDMMALRAREAAYSVAKAVFQSVSGLALAATYGNTAGTHKLVVAAASFDSDYVADLAGLLNDADSPEMGRSLILNNAYHLALSKDPALKNASASGSTEPLREGSTGRVAGFDIFRTNALPSAITSENTVGFGCVPSAIAVAMAPVQPMGDAPMLSLVQTVDDVSGIPLTYRQWYSPKTGAQWGAFECLFGAVAAQTAGLKRIVSA
jgi:hypothetical protein